MDHTEYYSMRGKSCRIRDLCLSYLPSSRFWFFFFFFSFFLLLFFFWRQLWASEALRSTAYIHVFIPDGMIANPERYSMRRAGCKGRTLVLKIKLHTYEVYTRQTVLPRAINLAEDLYNQSVLVLAKLEQEMPGMRIRLMGLRCTHLVSTKRPDTTAFFGLKPGSGATSNEPGKVLRNTSQVIDEHVRDMMPAELPEQDDNHAISVEDEIGSPYRRHGKEIMPNPIPPNKAPQAPDEWWQCPICSRPQPADERQFNSHIDACLSRQTIRDAVQQEQQAPPSRGLTPEPKRPRTGSEKKRGRQGAGQDPKQKKLCFG